MDAQVADSRLLPVHRAGVQQGYYLPIVSGRFDGFDENIGADRVVNHISTLPLRQRQGARDEILLFILNRLVGAKAADEIGLLGRAHRGDDPGPPQLGDLDGDVSDAAGAGVDEHSIALPQSGLGDQ